MNTTTLPDICFVLVETSHSGNIGAAARALKTMGFSQLRLVKPCRYKTAEAYARASGADNLIDDAGVFDSLSEAVSDCHMIFGTSARSRTLEWSTKTARETADTVCAGSSIGKAAIVFGRERSGLTNDELALCHHRLWIPSDDDFSSLNLASAVQVVAYELRQASAIAEPVLADKSEVPADAGMVERFFEHLERTLVEIEFIDPDNPRWSMRRLRRLFARAAPSQTELNLLRGILSAINRKT